MPQPIDVIQRTCTLLKRFDARQARSLLLYAGANVMSPLVESLSADRLGMLPAMGRPFLKQQPGTAEISELEILVEEQASVLFEGTWAEARVPSGALANLAVLASFTQPGDTIMVLPSSLGGHVSYQHDGIPRMLGLNVVAVDKGEDELEIDDAATAATVAKVRPRVLLVGGSVVLGFDSLPLTAASAKACGCISIFDMSHLAGLIAGRAFPNPLDHGFDVLVGSTYKSLGGPPGALIVGRDPTLAQRVRDVVSPRLLSNYDSGRLAPLAIALAEASLFMKDYASSMLSNAAALRTRLRGNGLSLLVRPEAPTHQIAVLFDGGQDGAKIASRAEESSILLSAHSRTGAEDRKLLRLGTQAITRHGMGPQEMRQIADLLAAVIEGVPVDDIGRKVVALSSAFRSTYYCLDASRVEEVLQSR